MNVHESLGCKLEHSFNIRFRYCETRIDYMGTCILMGNMSSFRIAMSDEWNTNPPKSQISGKMKLSCCLAYYPANIITKAPVSEFTAIFGEISEKIY